MQRRQPPLLSALLHGLNLVGTGWPSVALVLAAVLALAALRRPRLALLLAAVNVLRPLDTLLKLLTDRPRPSPALVRVTEHATGKSFPSGHVFSAMLLYGTLVVLIPALPALSHVKPLCRLLQAGCVAVVVLMGVARVAVGAHWPSDVLGGWLWGGLVVALLYAIRPYVERAPGLAGRNDRGA